MAFVYIFFSKNDTITPSPRFKKMTPGDGVMVSSAFLIISSFTKNPKDDKLLTNRLIIYNQQYKPHINRRKKYVQSKTVNGW